MIKKISYIIFVTIIGTLLILVTPYLIRNFHQNKISYIDYSTLETKIKTGDKFFLVISKTGCPDCSDFKEKLSKAKNFNYEVFIFEYNLVEDTNVVSKLDSTFPDFVFVPYVCFIQNGDINKFNENLDISKINDWLVTINS